MALAKPRHYCRNSHCRSKLKGSVDNPHKAFCTPFCYNQFFSWKCRVCEKPILKGRRRKQPDHCHAIDCRKAFRTYPEAFGYPSAPNSQNANYGERSAHFTGVKKAGLGLKQVIQAEVIDCRKWQEEVSADGVVSYVSSLTRLARVRLYFEDEAPAIGSGWRIVSADIGDKRVRLTDHFGRTAEVKLETYHSLRAQPFAETVQ
jgi:hypothetical protein